MSDASALGRLTEYLADVALGRGFRSDRESHVTAGYARIYPESDSPRTSRMPSNSSSTTRTSAAA